MPVKPHLQDLTALARRFKDDGKTDLAAVLMYAAAVAGSGDPHDLHRLSYLVDLFVKKILEEKEEKYEILTGCQPAAFNPGPLH